MASSSSTPPQTNTGFDHLYNVDKEALKSLKAQKPWNEGAGATRPRYFKNCYVSAGAAVKMLEHSLRGVEKGMSSSNRMPVEVSTTHLISPALRLPLCLSLSLYFVAHLFPASFFPCSFFFFFFMFVFVNILFPLIRLLIRLLIHLLLSYSNSTGHGHAHWSSFH